ncbi:hypothetical protein BH24PSE2_BH24PSE2_18030 [soil metagenome]
MTSYHVIQHEWGLPPFDPSEPHLLPIEPLLNMCRSRTPQLLQLSDVCYRDRIVSMQRYRNCDVSQPGIVAENAANPCEKRYRLLDGNHRVHKLIASGATTHRFYVLEPEDFRHLVEKYDRRRHPR